MVNRRSSTFLLLSRFFGLSNEYRFQLFKVIHDICYYGNGGYDFHTVYEMPIWLRKFTYTKLTEWYNKSNPNKNEDSWLSGKAKENAAKNKKVKPPTYITKASKK